jgi:hypothetical protein
MNYYSVNVEGKRDSYIEADNAADAVEKANKMYPEGTRVAVNLIIKEGTDEDLRKLQRSN